MAKASVASSATCAGMVVLQARDLELAQRPQHALARSFAVGCPHDELADEVVVVLRDGVALRVAAVPAHAGTAGQPQVGDRAGGGGEVRGRVLGVDAALDRVAGVHDVVGGERQRLTRGDAQLLGDEVELGDLLGHAVLHLEARVHLEEPELAVLVEALDGAGVHVAAAPRDLHRGLVHRGADLVAQLGRRALLDELLVAALRRAVALTEADDVAVRVGEHLELDVTRSGEVALHVALAPPEVRDGLTRRRLERLGCFVGAVRDLQAATTAAVRGLDRHRPPELVAERDHLGRVLDGVEGAGHRRHVGRPPPTSGTRSCRP